ncbi:MAG TPA: ATP-binding protein [Noviherbaspirillum sp.]|uniref:hybrid sensor histidine kinase/response regulator n=1 Tax=Noviherbaspirillum sp. TaxID=1926288 RepID=UPI002DDCA5D9|nr:ATP-binding protein [Noviherbaspirillum sp.]HEV2609036.1 ATP-binding protein [Noviherbaspirillum sp.]
MNKPETAIQDFLAGGSEMARLMRTHDWSGSKLGPPATWPWSLRRIVRLMLGTKFPMFVLWGQNLSCVYNDSYIPVLEHRHPGALGQPHPEIWPELWPELEPYIQRALAGESTFFKNHPLPMLRDGGAQARWFTFSFSPAFDDEDHICGVLCAGSETTDSVVMQQQLRDAESSLRQLNATLEQQVEQRTRERDRIWRNSQDLLLIIDGKGILRSVNPAWTSILGYPPAELTDQPFEPIVHPDDIQPTYEAVGRALRAPVVHFEVRIRHREGGFRWFSWTAAAEENLIYANGRDITVLKEQAEALQQTEEALRQAQKMEAVGQLTGGIAHDFNNLLAAMMGNLELMEFRLAQGRTADLLPYLKSAMSVVDRAAALTHRLLAFSRRQTLTPKPTDVNALVTSMEELIQRTAGPAIRVGTVLSPDLWRTLCDPHQLESALLNLAINARDAMPDGGNLTIETANVRLDERYVAGHEGAAPGGYIRISVTDSGTGMAPEVRERAFDPFFTTKPMGQGTGLGLSMVYGFVKQSGGTIRLYSEPGLGVTVKIYLPGYENEEQDDILPPSPAAGKKHGAAARILVVEDEEAVRTLIVEMLRTIGHSVREAGDGHEALQALEASQPVDLLITDVGLPGGMNGRQLSDAVRAMYPEQKVLFITGYAENAAIRNGLLEPGMEVMTKPFAMELLAGKVADMLKLLQR